MEIELTIKNYRCFSDEKPARILIKPGFTAFLGINNSGKSSLLKFFYEFRNLFQQLSETGIITFANDMKTIRLVGGLKSQPQNFGFPGEIVDQEEVFCNLNDRNLSIQIRLIPTSATKQMTPIMLERLDIIVQRGSPSWTSKLYVENREVPTENLNWGDNNHLSIATDLAVDLSFMLAACKLMPSRIVCKDLQ